MTETPEPKSPPVTVPPAAKPSRLYPAAAWVVIVAGIVFIVAVIFCAGAYLTGDGEHGHHQHHGPCPMHQGPPPPLMGPGGPDHPPGPPPGPPPAPTLPAPQGPPPGPPPAPAPPPGR